MKKNYIAPDFEKVTLNTSDIMQTSGGLQLGVWSGSGKNEEMEIDANGGFNW